VAVVQGLRSVGVERVVGGPPLESGAGQKMETEARGGSPCCSVFGDSVSPRKRTESPETE
jgi:hypothetical protein